MVNLWMGHKRFVCWSFFLAIVSQYVSIWRVGKVQEFEDVSSKEHQAGEMFIPGSLSLSHLEAYQRCYMDPTRYKSHFGRVDAKCDVSEKHKLAYMMIPKAGSSSSRIIMRRFFDAEYIKCRNTLDSNETFWHFTFTRDPMERFVSSFQEAMIRWPTNRYKIPKVLQPIFTNQSIRILKFSRDHDSMLNALEAFLREYDGLEVPNGHLRLQMGSLMPHPASRLGEHKPTLDAIYELKNMHEVFSKSLGQRNMNTTDIEGNEHAPPKALRAYKKKLHLNITHLSLEARRKICQLSALDFCCLNYPLPPECKGAVSCRWTEQQDGSSLPPAPSSSKLLIEAVSPYPPV